jgi:hypothetical protein
MADKGFENGCILMAHGAGHPPKSGHNCLYMNNNNELKSVHADANEYIFANSAFHRCAVTKSENQSIEKEIWTSLTFDRENYDVGGLHNSLVKNHRLTAAADGEYELLYHIKHDVDDKTEYQARILKNGFQEIDGTCNFFVGSKDTTYNIMGLASPSIMLNTDEYVEVQFYHDNSSAQNIISGNTFFSIKRIY